MSSGPRFAPMGSPGFAPPPAADLAASDVGPAAPDAVVDPFHGYLTGAADVIRAQATYMVNAQQANLIKQQVNREKIANCRRVLDEWLYEREHTPTAQDERERTQWLELRRSANDPPAGEVASAKALNDLLADAQRLHARGVRGPEVELSEDVVRHLNISSVQGSANAGLLKNDGRLDWPLALSRDAFQSERVLLGALIPEALRQAVNGRVEAGTLRALNAQVDKVQHQLALMIKDLPLDQHREAKRFLSQLEDGLQLLGRADAGNHFNHRYTARAETVGELVKHMTTKGLRFAPATAGDEAAYLAVQRALAEYDVGARSQLARK